MKPRVNQSLFILATAVIASVPCASAPLPGALGPVVQVNSLENRPQEMAAVAFDGLSQLLFAFGKFQNPGQVGTQDWDIPVRSFEETLVPGAPEVLANQVTASWQAWPRLAYANGHFLVGWESYLEPSGDGSEESVRARFVSTGGSPEGSVFQVNTYSSGPQRYVDVAGGQAGGFVVVWQSLGSGGNDQSETSIQAQLLDGVGQPIGTEFQVNTTTSGVQRYPRVARLCDGSFAIAWSDIGSGSGRGRFYDSAGQPLGDDFSLSTLPEDVGAYFVTIAGERRKPGSTDSARYLAAWSSYTAPSSAPLGLGDGWDVRARQFSAIGAPLGAPFDVNLPAAGDQWQPEVAIDWTGTALVAWTDAGIPTRAKIRPFSRDGAPLAAESEFLETGHASQRLRGLSEAGGGLFVAVWAEEASPEAVFARRFATSLIFSDGFESEDASGWTEVQSLVAAGFSS